MSAACAHSGCICSPSWEKEPCDHKYMCKALGVNVPRACDGLIAWRQWRLAGRAGICQFGAGRVCGGQMAQRAVE